MRFDLSLSPFGTRVVDLVEAARRAEEVGFDGIWTYDHLSGWIADAPHSHDPWILLTAIADATNRIHLGPLVLNATARHPAHIAVAAASLQEHSAGRVLLGLGAGGGSDRYGDELAMVGLPRRPAAERRDRTEEAVKAIRALWAGTEDLAAEFHPLTAAGGFLHPDPVPPIVVGVTGPRMAAVAGRVADAVNVHSWEDPQSLARVARSAADDDQFPVWVEAPMTDEWIKGSGRELLARIGAERVSYLWNHRAGIEAIESSATALGIQNREPDAATP
jgi:alkanesulfonate monooxygenase SsuD/methylene tetrahydromethanopterin reductase-like flavin-dependent oxidoreductase (luciferase family)